LTFVKVDGVTKKSDLLRYGFLTDVRHTTCIADPLSKTPRLAPQGHFLRGIYQTFSIAIWVLRINFLLVCLLRERKL
jgi:hypothetical protein